MKSGFVYRSYYVSVIERDGLQLPRFVLRPTLGHLMLQALGVVITFVPLLAQSWGFAGIWMVFTGAICTWILKKLGEIQQFKAILLGSPSLFNSTPASKLKRTLIILICAFGSTFLLAGLSLLTAKDRTNFSIAPVWNIVIILLLIQVSFFTISLLSKSNNLPQLLNWYLTISDTLQVKVKKLGDNWHKWHQYTRSIANIEKEIIVTSILIRDFNLESYEPSWRHSYKSMTGYFAPIVVPYLVLLFLPLAHVDLSKNIMGLSAIAWAVWSISYFLYFVHKDFDASIYSKTGANISEAQLYKYSTAFKMRALENYFNGSGQILIHVVVLALIPIYFDYIGLFHR